MGPIFDPAAVIGASSADWLALSLTGNRIPDAYHAAPAIGLRCEWVALDRGFSVYPGLRLINLLDSGAG